MRPASGIKTVTEPEISHTLPVPRVLCDLRLKWGIGSFRQDGGLRASHPAHVHLRVRNPLRDGAVSSLPMLQSAAPPVTLTSVAIETGPGCRQNNSSTLDNYVGADGVALQRRDAGRLLARLLARLPHGAILRTDVLNLAPQWPAILSRSPWMQCE